MKVLDKQVSTKKVNNWNVNNDPKMESSLVTKVMIKTLEWKKKSAYKLHKK